MPIQIMIDPVGDQNSVSPCYISLNIEVEDSDLEEIEGRMDDISPLLNRIARIMRRAAADRFRNGGPGWRPLAPSTVASKLAANAPPTMASGKVFPRFRQYGSLSAPATTILIRSGALRDSWVRKNDRNHFEDIDPEEGTVVIGSELPYASVHQMGSPPRLIVPVAAPALRFMVADGRWIFRKAVNHPGLPPRPVELQPKDELLIAEEVQAYLRRRREEDQGE